MSTTNQLLRIEKFKWSTALLLVISFVAKNVDTQQHSTEPHWTILNCSVPRNLQHAREKCNIEPDTTNTYNNNNNNFVQSGVTIHSNDPQNVTSIQIQRIPLGRVPRLLLQNFTRLSQLTLVECNITTLAGLGMYARIRS